MDLQSWAATTTTHRHHPNVGITGLPPPARPHPGPPDLFTALALGRWIENTADCYIGRFVKTARRYRTIQSQAGEHTITAADPLPADLAQALSEIGRARVAH